MAIKLKDSSGVQKVLDISSGGTGADNASSALDNLGGMPKPKMYQAFATGGNVASGGTVVTLTVPAGTYLVGGYVHADNDMPLWLNGVTDQTNAGYARCAEASFMKIMTFTAQKTLTLTNFTGATRAWYKSTCLFAIPIPFNGGGTPA